MPANTPANGSAVAACPLLLSLSLSPPLFPSFLSLSLPLSPVCSLLPRLISSLCAPLLCRPCLSLPCSVSRTDSNPTPNMTTTNAGLALVSRTDQRPTQRHAPLESHLDQRVPERPTQSIEIETHKHKHASAKLRRCTRKASDKSTCSGWLGFWGVFTTPARSQPPLPTSRPCFVSLC